MDLPALAYVGEFGWLGFLEDVDMVICHPLLRDEDLLTPIDHEVASLQPDSRVSLHSHRKRTEFSLLGKKLSHNLLCDRGLTND